MNLYVGAISALVPSLQCYSNHRHVYIHVCSENSRNQVRRVCACPFNWGTQSTEPFVLASSCSYEQPWALCKTAEPFFWRLGMYPNHCSLRKFLRGEHCNGCPGRGGVGSYWRTVEVCATSCFRHGDRYETRGRAERAKVAKEYTRNVCRRDSRHKENERKERGEREASEESLCSEEAPR